LEVEWETKRLVEKPEVNVIVPCQLAYHPWKRKSDAIYTWELGHAHALETVFPPINDAQNIPRESDD
jgi:hypothetical protein